MSIRAALVVALLATGASAGELAITSPAFEGGRPIPVAHTRDGENRSPALAWSGVPAGTKSFALIVDDPDAPTARPFVHWVVFDLPAASRGLAGGLKAGDPIPGGGHQGTNGFHVVGWRGPSPPRPHGPHRYVFLLLALDVPSLGLEDGATKEAVLGATKGHVLGEARLVGTYDRE